MDILKTRFWDIAKYNLICLGLYFILIFVHTFLTSLVFFPIDVSDYLQGYTNYGEMFAVLIYRMPYVLVLFSVPVIAFGPAVAGFAVILRSYVRRDTSFSSDFTDGMKKFFWRSLLVTLISTVIAFCLGIAYKFYLTYLDAGFWKTALLWIIMIFSLLFLMMHLYIYQILVEYKLPIWQLYRYSYVFSILRFFPNLLVLILVVAITVIPFMIHILLGAAVLFVIMIGLNSYIINFFTWPAIEKHLDPIMKEQRIKKIKLY